MFLTCFNYNYTTLTTYWWPALIAGVQAYSESDNLSYVGFSNGCRVGLSSLEIYNVNGKPDAGQFINESEQWEYKDLTAYPIDTFVGVGCPGVFNGSSRFIDKSKANGDVAINSLTQRGFNHVTSKNYGVLTDPFAILMWITKVDSPI